MAPDERDRRFDKALARHLRNTAPAGDSGRVPGIPESHDAACPDPETLAAYHERSLFPEQLNSLKEHIVGCAHCQTILAHLETTEGIPLQTAQLQAVAETAQPAASRKSRRAVLLRGARWQWLAPAGALAAGLLVWIALHENRPSALQSLKQVEVAKNHAPLSSSSPVSNATPEVSPAAKAVPAPSHAQADKVAGDDVVAESRSGAAKSNEKQDFLARAVPSRSPTERESRLRKDSEPEAAAELRRAEAQLDRDAKAGAAGKQENAEVQLQAQTSNNQLQNQSNVNGPAVAGPAPLSQMEQKKSRATPAPAPPPAAPQPVVSELASSYDSTSALQVAGGISNPRLISAPGSAVVWRAGRGGLIELSKDGGSSWSRQASGVRADLLTGSAISGQVCWIVGRGGIVLLTTDGGAHWSVIKSPLSEDLGGVRASDALHATIWNARSTKSFQTNDGGLTWTPVPSP